MFFVKTRILFISSILASLCLLGCYTLPSKRGQWTGTIGSARLYTWEGEGQDCVTLAIETGPGFKDFKPKEVVLVNPDGVCYTTNEISPDRVHVKGTLMQDFPLSRQTGKPLDNHTNTQASAPELSLVIKVKRLEKLR